MLTNKDILRIAMEQSAADIGCKAEDFLMIRKDGKIVYFGEVIADSFIDFMRKELEVPDYLSCGVSHIHQLFKAAAAIYQTGFICQLKAALLIKSTRIKVCFQYPKHDRTILIF